MPLNYSEPHGEKAAIAITRYPAAVLAGSPAYRGPILFNPGGPGGSGVNFIAVAGSALAQIVGPEFDILGFDPRGKPVRHPLYSVALGAQYYFHRLKVLLTRSLACRSLKQIWSDNCGAARL